MPLSLHEAYRYCLRCGTATSNDHNYHFSKCSRCGYVQHFNPVTAVGVVIHNAANEVILIRRNRDPGKGKLGLPGGFVDLGETAEVAARREVKEEIGVCVDELQFIGTFPNQYIYQEVVVPVLDIFFAARIDDVGTMELAADEVSEVGKFALNDETLAQMAFQSNRLALEVIQDR